MESSGIGNKNGTFSPGDTSWVLASSALVFLMIPGVGFFYGGLTNSRNVLSMMFLSLLSVAVVSIQWVLFGYSLSFSSTATGPFIGNFNKGLLINIRNSISGIFTTVPEIVFVFFQCMFAGITPALAVGGSVERIRIIPCTIFFFVWTTIVYDPIAYWNWTSNGWLAKFGVLDFAGGLVVHVNSGFTGLVLAHHLGRRIGYKTANTRPNNIPYIVLGTALIWFGWFGFNAGSAGGANLRAGYAFATTNSAAAASGLTWVFLAFIVEQERLSVVNFCNGVIAGLIAITSGAGFVSVWASLAIGFITAIVCYYALSLKSLFGVDDVCDVLAIHGIGGIVGAVLTGVFAEARFANYNGAIITGGWLDGNFVQLPKQMLGSIAIVAWSTTLTFAIVKAMSLVTFLDLRASSDAQTIGIDKYDLGEYSYNYLEDYVRKGDNNGSRVQMP